MFGREVTGSIPSPTRVFYYSAFTPEARLLWKVQLLSSARRLEIFSGIAKPHSTRREPVKTT
ncbi:hypothetical protein Hanom_Chr09g00869051 [Helianthus anomalus]